MSQNVIYTLITIFSSVVFYVLGAATVRYNLFPYSYILRFKNNLVDKSKKYTNNRMVQLHNIYRTEHADIVMLGDSLTANVNWSELLGRTIINRGVGADITDGYLHRMDAIYKLTPKKVFINGGTNDFVGGYSVKEVFANYQQIIALLQEHNIKPYVQSVVYTHFDDVNKKIKEINLLLQRYCNENQIEYIDLNKKLSSENRLIDKYTLDGSHLNAAGYTVWRDAIEQYI